METEWRRGASVNDGDVWSVSHSARGYKCHNLGPFNDFFEAVSLRVEWLYSMFNHFKNKFGLILSDPHRVKSNQHCDWKQAAPQWVGFGL